MQYGLKEELRVAALCAEALPLAASLSPQKYASEANHRASEKLASWVFGQKTLPCFRAVERLSGKLRWRCANSSGETAAGSAVTIDGATYTVDNAGNRTAKTDQRAAVTTNYGYDAIYQLLSATPSSGAAESYTYDPVGNRLSSAGVASYSYNSSNELTSNSNATYGYDLNGNAVTKNDSTGITTYAWDFENRLTSVTLPGSGGTVSFKYDPLLGRRIYKSSSAATSIYAYDGNNLIEETNSSGAAVARYSQGLNIDEPLAMLRAGTTSFYHADGLGSITSLSNSSGAIAQTYTFDSFGNLTGSTGSLTNPFRYTAREFDAEAGLYYFRARYYDQSTGRFLSEDPLQFVAGINFYPYALNAPVNLRDPSGKNAGVLVYPIAGGLCFGSGVCETIVIVGGGVAAVYLTYTYLQSRSRPHADPIPWPGVKDPGKCDDEQGKCKPCPPDSPYWDQQGKPGAHGSPTGLHYHWWHWNQKPYPDCTCVPARLDGAEPPPGGTPYTPGGPAWP
jgi:RHS repeat-associated protein